MFIMCPEIAAAAIGATMHRIVKAEPQSGYRLNLRFDDGVEGEVDLSDLVGEGVFAAWRDPAEFRKVFIDPQSHTVAWPGDIDLCPESLHAEVAAGADALVVHDRPSTKTPRSRRRRP